MRKILAISALLLTIFLLTSVTLAGQLGVIQPKTENSKQPRTEDIKKKLSDNDDVRIIVTLKEEATDANIEKLKSKFGLTIGKKGWKLAYPNGFAATIKRGKLDTIEKDPLVARVDKDQLMNIQLETANYWSGVTTARQAPSVGYGVDGDRDGLPYNYSTSDVVIAVVDTGIDPKHKDLTGLNNGGNSKIIGWYDAVNYILSPYDDNGHGTHVSSIAAGEGDDGSRYKGVAPGAALVGVKVCSSSGSCWSSDIIEGFNWVIGQKLTYNIKIMTVSLGGWGSSDGTDPTAVAANNVVSNGIVTTIAAGNSGDYKYSISSPGSAANAITVGAIADPGYNLRFLGSANSAPPINSVSTNGDIGLTSPETKQKPTGQMNLEDNGWYLAEFSSRGPTADNRVKPDVVAPGVSITAAQSIYPNAASYHGGYVTYSGTSMATPFVAGVAALLLDANYTLTPTQVKNYIRGTTEDFGASGCDIDFGCGRVRAMNALAAVTGINRGNGPVLNHIRAWSSYTDTASDWKVYPVSVTNDNFPLATTLILYDYSGGWSFDAAPYVYDPLGGLVAYPYGWGRQTESVVSPESLGIWNVDLYRYTGSGRFSLDISYK